MFFLKNKKYKIIAFALTSVLVILYCLFHCGCFSERYSVIDSHLHNYIQAIEIFELDNGRIPTTKEGLQSLFIAPDDLGESWDGPYIKEFVKDIWGNEYKYIVPGLKKNQKFSVYSVGPNKVDEQCKGDDHCL
ncbi:MAG: type II secretion system protein GspG [bacterium]